MWKEMDTAPHDRIIWLKKGDSSYHWCARWVDVPTRGGPTKSGWWVYGARGWVEAENQEKFNGWYEYLDIPYHKQQE